MDVDRARLVRQHASLGGRTPLRGTAPLEVLDNPQVILGHLLSFKADADNASGRPALESFVDVEVVVGFLDLSVE